VRVTSSTATELHLRVSGVTRPYWLVLGQSINTGWKASIDGSGQKLGAPTLVDGFANGWLIQPTGARTVSMTLKWAPQSGENVALLVSALAVAACVALVLWPRRRRSRAMAAAAQTAPPVDLDAPVVTSPFAAAKAVPLVIAAMVGVTYGLVAAILVPQAGFLAIFLGVAGGLTLALVVPRTRGLLGLAVMGFATAAVLYILVRQAAQHFFFGGGWPSEFEPANMLVWTAIVFLGADAVVELVRRLRR
jgi:arabinofuranan 3-O-arabinosyltransferase